jgi:hypothetical protein
MSWEDAIRQVLQTADGALHYTEVAERILSLGLRRVVGATPAATVASILSTSLKDTEGTPYIRVERGVYAVRDRNFDGAGPIDDIITPADGAVETGALRSFGMFWQRELVNWGPAKPRLLGRQGLGASEVNFADQLGIYLLHDRERVIYVGRATEAISVRLRSHTADRLGGRWDRFSWFGLRGVAVGGELADFSSTWTQSVVVDTMEALLIETLEPPLNRKRGDNFSGSEYLQCPDPKIDEAKKKAWLADLALAAKLT